MSSDVTNMGREFGQVKSGIIHTMLLSLFGMINFFITGFLLRKSTNGLHNRRIVIYCLYVCMGVRWW